MRINRAEDFELAFNSIIRMYMRNYEDIANLDGVKRHIDTLKSEERLGLISDYEKVRSALIKRLHELWKNEEGHLYEEVSEGVFIRKRSGKMTNNT